MSLDGLITHRQSAAEAASAYEKALRERLRVLEEGRDDPAWLNALENQMARSGAAMVGAAPRTLTCVDALAGCGLRAVRLALEVAVSHARRDKATNIHPAPHTVVRIWAVIAARGRAQEALQVISIHS